MKAAFSGQYAALLVGGLGGHGTIIFAMYTLHNKERNNKVKVLKWLGALIRT